MNDWTSGYVADIGYTFGYYAELNPLRTRLAFLSAGLVPPDSGIHCELGFGQGISANIHAAASASTWYGTDFNPAQAGFAQALAQSSGADVRLYDQAFADFCIRDDLPAFDSIGLHGIWSWINDENRTVIVDFIRRKLKVGGVLYISYNTQPGWAAFAPMRHLMTEHADVIGSAGVGTAKRVDGALQFAERLLATNPMYANANPTVNERLAKVKDQDRHYLAHEYFNRDWQPMHFATMANWLVSAKIEFAGSAQYLDHIDEINVSPDQQNLLKEIPDSMFSQTVRDFMVNQQFRKDYWVKGPRRLKPLEQSEALRTQRVILLTPRSEITLKIKGARGEAMLQESVYSPILDVLSDYEPKTLAQIENAVKDRGLIFAQVLQAVMILAGVSHIAAVQESSLIPKAKKLTDKLNAYFLDKARSSNEIAYLASPVIGGGVTVGRFEQLFLLAITRGMAQPDQWAQFVWSVLASQGQRIVKDGKTIDVPEDNISELQKQAQTFASKQLPIFKSLLIA